MKVIIFEKDGSACIHSPYTENGHTCESQLNSKDFKDSTNNAELYIQDDTEFPSKILFNAWEIKNKKMAVNIPNAKLLAHDLRRDKREEALKANTAILTKNGAGIPLAANENAATAASENAAYMLIDDAAQVSIDASTSEADLLSALSDIGID
jgi:hypothetical protein